jgi:mannose-6-phosphate isomerase-like protein (cupin superfamily)
MRTLLTFATCLLGAMTALVGAEAPGPVTYLPSADVSAAFAKGRPLLEVDGYKIHASRREAAGQAEVHTRDTDVIYVFEGSATIVTGGTVVAPKTVAVEEIRGSAIEGGESRTLSKGDVLVVPNGVPHWFKTVEPPLLYYVVKVAAKETSSAVPGGSR